MIIYIYIYTDVGRSAKAYPKAPCSFQIHWFPSAYPTFPPALALQTCLQFVRLGSDKSVNSLPRWTRAPSFSHTGLYKTAGTQYNNAKTPKKQTYLRRGFSALILRRVCIFVFHILIIFCVYFVFCFGDFCSHFRPRKNSSKTTNQNNWKPHSLGVKRIEVRNMVFSWIFSNFLSWFGWLDCKNLII